MNDADQIAKQLVDDVRKRCDDLLTLADEWSELEDRIATSLRTEREKVAAKFAAFAGPDGEPKSVKWPAVAGVSDRDELWEKYICRDDEDAHAVLSLIAFIDYRLQAAAEAAKEKNDA